MKPFAGCILRYAAGNLHNRSMTTTDRKIKMENRLLIDTNGKQNEMNDLFGIFFEDLNHAADGGLYAELIQNRSFEFEKIDNPDYHAMTAWECVENNGKAAFYIETFNPVSAGNPQLSCHRY